MEKDARLRAALVDLRDRFGDAVEIVDHWDADLLAVGAARRGERTRLVYVAVLPDEDGLFDVALEVPPRSNTGLPFEEAGWHRQLVLSEVADGLTSEEKTELTALRRENARLREERDILKKAAAWFAQESTTTPKRRSDS